MQSTMADNPSASQDAAPSLSYEAVRSKISTIKTALDALTAGGVDAVVLSDGAFLVGNAKTSVTQSEARYRHLINQMGGYVAELLPNGEVLYLNEAMASLLGCDATDGVNLDFFERLRSVTMQTCTDELKMQFLQLAEL